MTQGDFGQELKENNEQIVECILLLREQRDELAFLIEKQYEERKKLETEMERITYKLCLINKSLSQRLKAKSQYDRTLKEVEENYSKLVKNSGELLKYIRKEFTELDSIMDKRTNTEGDFNKTIINNTKEVQPEIPQHAKPVIKGTTPTLKKESILEVSNPKIPKTDTTTAQNEIEDNQNRSDQSNSGSKQRKYVLIAPSEYDFTTDNHSNESSIVDLPFSKARDSH